MSDAQEDVDGRKEPSRNRDVTDGQRITAINNLEESISNLEASVRSHEESMALLGDVGRMLANINGSLEDIETVLQQVRMHTKEGKHAIQGAAVTADKQTIEPPDDVSDEASAAAAWLVSNGFDLSKLELYKEDGELVIDRKRDHEQSDEFMEFTSEHFGKDKPGWISWGTYEQEDSDDPGYYPQAFRLPLENYDEVFV